MKDFLSESMHSLVTPELTGTNEEMITAINYWVACVGMLRSLKNTVTSYQNQEAIIKQLDVEIEALKAELGNTSAEVTVDGAGRTTMYQPIGSVSVDTPPPVVDLSVTQESSTWLQRQAGIKTTQKSGFERL